MVCPICKNRWAPSKTDIRMNTIMWDPLFDESDVIFKEKELFELDKLEMCPDCAEDEF